MLSYQHAFHAGNHADILKHYVLSFVLSSLNKKDKPYTFFDTHSGSGLYDLYDNRILKTGEAEKGIIALEKLLTGDCSLPESFNKYISLIKEYTKENLYPGSPEIEKRLMRSQDTLMLSELHPQEIENLKANILHPNFVCNNNSKKDNPKIRIHNMSGWDMIKGNTPPITKRGAVLIDPSYEETQDYIDASNVISEINKKWSNGIIMLWYPLLAHRESEIQVMKENIEFSAKRVNPNVEISDLMLEVYDKEESSLPRLYGSGMLVINSPWKLEEEANIVIPYLKKNLSPLYK